MSVFGQQHISDWVMGGIKRSQVCLLQASSHITTPGQHRADAGMRVPHVVHRVFIVLATARSSMSKVYSVSGLRRQEEPTDRAGPFDQVRA
jgi:hypothetical protein